MAAKKETEEVKKETEPVEQNLSMAEVKKQVAEILAQAQQEAKRIVQEAKAAVGGQQKNSRMSPEELAAYNAYMNELVEIELFKDNGKYKDDVYVAVNGENCVIKRGERVKIKRKFAEVLDQSMQQKKETAKYMEQKSGEWAKASDKL